MIMNVIECGSFQLFFANDMVLLENSREKLQRLAKGFGKVCKRWNFKVNRKEQGNESKKM